MVVDDEFKDVTNQFNDSPDVVVHGVGVLGCFVVLTLQSYGGGGMKMCVLVKFDTISLYVSMELLTFVPFIHLTIRTN